MTPQKEPDSNGSPSKSRRSTAAFDRNHEFLMRCILESKCRINFAAVGKSHGLTAGSAKQRFYKLKSSFARECNPSGTMEIEYYDVDATPTKATKATKDYGPWPIKNEDEKSSVKTSIKVQNETLIKKEENDDVIIKQM